METLNKIIKDFFIGGVIIALVNYIITLKHANNIKYAVIISHGMPIIFITTLLMINSKHRSDFVREGIYITLLLALAFCLLYFLIIKNFTNIYLTILFVCIFWMCLLYIYTMNDKK